MAPINLETFNRSDSREKVQLPQTRKNLPEEQEESKKGSLGKNDQLFIDKTVLRDCKKRHTNLSMSWLDYRKACDLVPHSWVNECMEMFGGLKI